MLSVALRPQKPQGLLGTGAQDSHLDFHTAPELSARGVDSQSSRLGPAVRRPDPAWSGCSGGAPCRPPVPPASPRTAAATRSSPPETRPRRPGDRSATPHTQRQSSATRDRKRQKRYRSASRDRDRQYETEIGNTRQRSATCDRDGQHATEIGKRDTDRLHEIEISNTRQGSAT